MRRIAEVPTFIRKVLIDEHDIMFDRTVSGAEFDKLLSFKGLLRPLWRVQGKHFWERFLFTLQGRMYMKYYDNFRGQKAAIQQLVEQMFVWMQEKFAKDELDHTLLFDIIEICRIDKPVKDSFRNPNTRQLFLRVFGEPSCNLFYKRVELTLPIFQRFIGAIFVCYQRWHTAQCSENELTKNGPHLFEVNYNVVDCVLDDPDKPPQCEQTMFVSYFRERLEGSEKMPLYTAGYYWRGGNPSLVDHKNPMYGFQGPNDDWRGDPPLSFPEYNQFLTHCLEQKKRHDLTHGSVLNDNLADKRLKNRFHDLHNPRKSTVVDIDCVMLNFKNILKTPDSELYLKKRKNTGSQELKLLKEIEIRRRKGLQSCLSFGQEEVVFEKTVTINVTKDVTCSVEGKNRQDDELLTQNIQGMFSGFPGDDSTPVSKAGVHKNAKAEDEPAAKGAKAVDEPGAKGAIAVCAPVATETDLNTRTVGAKNVEELDWFDASKMAYRELQRSLGRFEDGVCKDKFEEALKIVSEQAMRPSKERTISKRSATPPDDATDVNDVTPEQILQMLPSPEGGNYGMSEEEMMKNASFSERAKIYHHAIENRNTQMSKREGTRERLRLKYERKHGSIGSIPHSVMTRIIQDVNKEGITEPRQKEKAIKKRMDEELRKRNTIEAIDSDSEEEATGPVERIKSMLKDPTALMPKLPSAYSEYLNICGMPDNLPKVKVVSKSEMGKIQQNYKEGNVSGKYIPEGGTEADARDFHILHCGGPSFDEEMSRPTCAKQQVFPRRRNVPLSDPTGGISYEEREANIKDLEKKIEESRYLKALKDKVAKQAAKEEARKKRAEKNQTSAKNTVKTEVTKKNKKKSKASKPETNDAADKNEVEVKKESTNDTELSNSRNSSNGDLTDNGAVKNDDLSPSEEPRSDAPGAVSKVGPELELDVGTDGKLFVVGGAVGVSSGDADNDLARKLKCCSSCGNIEPAPKTYKKCMKCKQVGANFPRFYCSKQCQVDDWNLKHKREHRNNLID